MTRRFFLFFCSDLKFLNRELSLNFSADSLLGNKELEKAKKKAFVTCQSQNWKKPPNLWCKLW